jgi:hypothetical protein
VRATAKGEGLPLTRLNAIALAGRWYTSFIGQREDDAGPSQDWQDLSDNRFYASESVARFERNMYRSADEIGRQKLGA